MSILKALQKKTIRANMRRSANTKGTVVPIDRAERESAGRVSVPKVSAEVSFESEHRVWRSMGSQILWSGRHSLTSYLKLLPGQL